MADEPIDKPIYEQLPGEPSLWYSRFTRFRLMVPDRSIAAVFQAEEIEKEKAEEKAKDKTEENRGKPRRTEPPGHWYEKAKQWKWEERAAAWDVELTETLEQEIIRDKKIVLLSGFAQMHRRVAELDKQIQKLLEYATKEQEFNANLTREIREYLTDIAEEVGERVKKKEVNNRGLPPNVYIGFDPNKDGSEP